MKGPLRLVFVLFLACAVAAGSLAFVNAATKDRIAAFAGQEREAAMKQVFTEAESFRELLPGRQWEALSAGAVVGRVFAATIQGYGGPIVSFFGLDGENAVTGVRVLSHSETPGLGAKITAQEFLSQFGGLKADEVALTRDDPRGRVDAVTAATISSRALTASLRATIDAFLKGELK